MDKVYIVVFYFSDKSLNRGKRLKRYFKSEKGAKAFFESIIKGYENGGAVIQRMSGGAVLIREGGTMYVHTMGTNSEDLED